MSLARPTPFEDFNENSILLDVDGNSWSDRLVIHIEGELEVFWIEVEYNYCFRWTIFYEG